MAGSMLVSSTGNIAINGQHQAIQKSNMRIKHNNDSGGGGGSANVSDNDSSDSNKEPVITRLRPNDVIMGRGGFTNNYIGNSNFRKLVNEHKKRYLCSSKMEKPKVARDVVRLWKELDPPGRFLQKKEDAKTSKRGEPTVWIECSDKKAQEKASQSLRERTPDVLPYLSKLQEHRDQVREKGVSMISQHYQGASSNTPLDQGGSDHTAHMSVKNPGDMTLPSMVGSSLSSLQPQQQSFMDQSMNSSMNGSMHSASHGMMQMNAVDENIANRRMSMPAGGGECLPNIHHSSAVVTPEGMRQQMASARRTSMPTISHLQGGNGMYQHPAHHVMMGHPDMAFSLERQRQQVLHDAYSAVELHGGVDTQTNQMFMEQMMMREREMMHLRERDLMHRQAMMREQCFMQQHMPYPSFAGSMGLGAVTRDCDVMMPEHEKMMIAAAEKQQLLLQESMKDSMGVKRHQTTKRSSARSQAKPSHVASGGTVPRRTKGQDMEPLPIDIDNDENYVIPLDIVPDAAQSSAKGSGPAAKEGKSATERKAPAPKKSSPASDSKGGKKEPSPAEGTAATAVAVAGKSAGNRSSSAPSVDVESRSSEDEGGEVLEETSPAAVSNTKNGNQKNGIPVPLNDTATRSGKLKSAFKKSSNSDNVAAAAGGKGSIDGGAPSDEYQKTLQNYMANHQVAASASGAVDIDDDISDSEDDVGGVDTTAWIQQALHDSGDLATPRSMKRKKKRKSSRQDVASQDGSQIEGPNPDSGIGMSGASGHSRITLLKDDLMSTDGKSMDCKSLDGMSFMSLAMSEMEKSMEELHVSGTPDDVEVDSDMESESLNFESHHGERKMNRSSNQSVMSELTDFEDSDDDGVGDDDGL